MSPEKLLEKSGELTAEDLEQVLKVGLSRGIDRQRIKNNIDTGVFLRFVVTNDFDIIMAPGSMLHDEVMENNGLDWKDCAITNGVLREGNEDNLMFIYHSTSRSVLHSAVQKKVMKSLA
jgi:hypothetical protein